MGGGLLNLVSEGNKNIFLNGNPNKTFFSTKYKKYTNFGIQKLRLDVNGSRKLNMTTESQFLFNVRDFGDLLIDTYLVLTLPNIWSPIVEILPPPNNFIDIMDTNYNRQYVLDHFMRNIWPYEFKWIENLGVQLIKRVRYIIGSVVIQDFTGDYLFNMVNRDFSAEKRELFDEMTGNTKELNDPANYAGRTNNYPNSIFNQNWLPNGPEPSIRGRKIYVPLNIWSTLNSKLALPLVSLTKQNLKIEITCRPIQELFVVRFIPTPLILNQFNELIIRINTDTFNTDTSLNSIQSSWNTNIRKEYLENCQLIGEYVMANQNENRYLFYRFVNPTFSPIPGADINDISGIRFHNGTVSGTSIDAEFYESTQSIWDADIHLLCNYVFLSQEEREIFQNKKQQYLVKFVDEKDYLGIQGSSMVKLFPYGLVTSWMWFLQRSDVQIKNQWSNYTNWDSKNIPFPGINNLITSYKDQNLNSFIYKFINKQINLKSGLANLSYSDIKNSLYRFLDTFGSNDMSGSFNNHIIREQFSEYLNIYINNNWFQEQFPDISSINIDNVSNSILEKASSTIGFSIIENPTGSYLYLPNFYSITGPLHMKNEIDILKSATILFDGKIRENSIVNDVYNYVEPYLRSNGRSKKGLFCYNFCLNTNPFDTQPNGAINLSKFSQVDIELNLIQSKKNLNAKTKLLVNNSGEVIGINKSTWQIFDNTYKMHFMQERYILLEFENGNITVNNLT